MKLNFVGASLLATFLSLVAAAASDAIDLAPDLGYLRIHSIVQQQAALTAALQSPRALVLDLRHPVDERDAGELLHQQLANHPAKSRLFILVSPVTPVPVVGAVAASSTPLVTFGVKGSRPTPQVVVEQSPEADRRAFDALATGTTLAALLSGTIEKERFDEASLVHEFKNGHPDAQPTASGEAPATESPDRLTDRVLQRALHLHRALQALKR